MADLAQLIVDVKQQKTVQQLNNIQNKLTKVGKTASDVGTAFLAGWSFTKVIASIQSFGRSLERSKVASRQFATIFRNSMYSASQSVKMLTNSFSQTQTAAKQMMAIIGGKVLQFGFNDKMITDISSKIAKLAQNTAAALGKPLNNEMFNKFTNAMTGQVGGLKQIGIIIDKNSTSFKNQVDQLQSQLNLTKQQAQAYAIYNQMLKQGQKYTGAAQEKIKSISNSIQSLKNTFNDIIGSKIGKIMSTIFSPIISGIQKLLKTEFFSSIVALSTSLGLIIAAFTAIKLTLGKIFGFGWKALVNYLQRITKLSTFHEFLLNEACKERKEELNNVKDMNAYLKQQLLIERRINYLRKERGFSKKFSKKYTNVWKKVWRDVDKSKSYTSGFLQRANTLGNSKVFTAQGLIAGFQQTLATSSSSLLNKASERLTNVFSNLFPVISYNSYVLHGHLADAIISIFKFIDLTSYVGKFVSSISALFMEGFKAAMTQIAAMKIGQKVGTSVGTAMGSAASVAAGAAVAKSGFFVAIGLFFKKILSWCITGLGWLTGILFGLLKGLLALLTPITVIILGIIAGYKLVQMVISKIKTGMFFKLGSEDPIIKKIANWLNETEQAQKKVKQAAERFKKRQEQVKKIYKDIAEIIKDITKQLALVGVTDQTKKDQIKYKQALDQQTKARKKYNDAYNDYNRLTKPQDRKAAAQRMLQAAKQIAQKDDKVRQIQKAIYDKRKAFIDKLIGLNDWFRSQVETISNWSSNKELIRNVKMQNILSELLDLKDARKNLRGDDLIANLKKQAQLKLKYSGLQIDALKQQANLAMQFRSFVVDTAKKMLQFKPTSASAIQVNTTEGYKFQTSKETSLVLPQSLITNQQNLNDINNNILRIQQQSYGQLQNIYKVIDNIQRQQRNGSATLIPVRIP